MGAGTMTRDVDLPNPDAKRWLALAQKALAGGSFEEKLTSRTDDGIRIEPLSQRSATAEPLPRTNPTAPWIVSQRVDDPDIARASPQALEDIAQGATGLSLVFEGAPNAFGYGLPRTAEALEAVLDGVPLNRVQVRVDAHPWSRAVADWMLAFLGKRRSDPTKLNLSFGIDPAAIFAGTGRLRTSIEALQESMPQSLAHFFAMGVPGVLLEADGRVFHNAGATEAQELGTMMASVVSYLRMFEKARQPLVYAAPHIGFAVSVDQDQFVSIAKLRALRKLWARIQETCSIPASTASIHAETSYRMMTMADPETNILRTAIAAFAAATGGADSISILPHTIAHGLPAGFARRVARNAQLIMAHESHLHHVADPVAGSGAVEALTDDLCAAAWAEFQRIEAEGGVLASLQQGYIQNRVQTAAARRNAAYRSGERGIVGTTLFRAPNERPVDTLPQERRPALTEGVATCEPLFAVRIDQSIGAGS